MNQPVQASPLGPVMLDVVGTALSRDDARACAVENALGAGRDGAYWLRLRAFCQARAGQTEASVDLARLAGLDQGQAHVLVELAVRPFPQPAGVAAVFHLGVLRGRLGAEHERAGPAQDGPLPIAAAAAGASRTRRPAALLARRHAARGRHKKAEPFDLSREALDFVLRLCDCLAGGARPCDEIAGEIGQWRKLFE